MTPMRPAVPTPIPAVLAIVALAELGSGCRATSADVDRWAQTERGPTKLVALVEQPRYGVELRARALLAIVAMDRVETNTVTTFTDAIDHLAASDDADKDEVFEATIPGLERAMNGGGRPVRIGEPPSTEQGNAKDAAVELVRHLRGAPRERLMRAVMSYFAADFPRRAMVGVHGPEDTARTFGPTAVPVLVAALTARLDKDAIPKIASIIAAVGDDATKRAAADRLVAIEHEIESPPYFEWLEGEVRRSLSVGTEPPSETRVLASATLTRESILVSGAFPAMKSFSSVPAVASRLIELASHKPTGNLSAALMAMFQERRSHALNALEGGANAGHVEALLALALDATNPPTLREVAFDRLAETRAQNVIPRMWPLVSATGVEGDANAQRQARALRARAAELVLQIGGASALGSLFTNLPADPTVAFEPAELEGYANRIVAMQPVPASVRADVRAAQWWRRVIAIHVVAKSGSAADVAILERLLNDPMPTVGASWRSRDPAQDTVGKVARDALALMRERLRTPAPTH